MSVKTKNNSLSLTHSLTLSQNLFLFSVCGLCRFYDLILKWNQSTANKFTCSSNGQMIRHVWAHQLLLIHAFAPEKPLLFRVSPFNKPILILLLFYYYSPFFFSSFIIIYYPSIKIYPSPS